MIPPIDHLCEQALAAVHRKHQPAPGTVLNGLILEELKLDPKWGVEAGVVLSIWLERNLGAPRRDRTGTPLGTAF